MHPPWECAVSLGGKGDGDNYNHKLTDALLWRQEPTRCGHIKENPEYL